MFSWNQPTKRKFALPAYVTANNSNHWIQFEPFGKREIILGAQLESNHSRRDNTKYLYTVGLYFV